MHPLNFELETICLAPNADFPNNNRCPVLVYRGAFRADVSPSTVEEWFARNEWTNSWRDGVYEVHHYHSTAHEVLGCYAGSAELRVGGPNGESLKVGAGDVIVIPAGVAHKKHTATEDFRVVGAYAQGREYDMEFGASDRKAVDERLANLPLPKRDPVTGEESPLLLHWC